MKRPLVALALAALLPPSAVAQVRFAVYYNDIAALVAAPVSPTIDIQRVAVVKYTGVTGDIDTGGVFYYDPASVLATNTTTVFKPTNANGRWIRNNPPGASGGTVGLSDFDTMWFRTNTGVVRPALGKTLPSWINVTDAQYGADPTGVADSAAAIQSALNVAQTNTRPSVVYLPTGLYRTTASITVTNSNVTIRGDGRRSTIIRDTTSGIGRVIYVHNTAARLFNVYIEGLSVEGTNGLASPPNGIEFVNCSEVGIRDVYGTKLNNGLVIDGCENAHAEDFTFTANNVAVYQTRQNASGFGYANLWASDFLLYQNTNASFKIDGAVSKSSYRDGWIEATTNGFQLLNRATTDVEMDNISINDVQFHNIAGQGFDGGRFLSATASGVTNYFVIQNLSIENSKALVPGASNAIEFLKLSNTNANTGAHDVSVRRSFFNDMTVSAIYADNFETGGEISQNWVGVLPEVTGLGTWFFEIHPGAMLMRDTNNVAVSIMARTGGNDIQYYTFRTNSALGFFVFDNTKSFYWDIGNDGNDMTLSSNLLTVVGNISGNLNATDLASGTVAEARLATLNYSKLTAGQSSALLTNDNLFLAASVKELQGFSRSTTYSWDLDGNRSRFLELTNNTTVSFANVPTATNVAEFFSLSVSNTGSFTLAFTEPPNGRWPAGEPVIGAGAKLLVNAFWDGYELVLSSGSDGLTLSHFNTNQFTTNSGTWPIALKPAFTATNITFPATQTASSGANTLDDYEEGTWVPTDGSGAGLAFSNTSGNCRYVKVGRNVMAYFNVTYPVTTNGTATAIAGLPFTAAATVNNVQGGTVNYTGVGFNMSILILSGGTSFNLYKNTGVGVLNSEMSDQIVRGTLVYEGE